MGRNFKNFPLGKHLHDFLGLFFLYLRDIKKAPNVGNPKPTFICSLSLKTFPVNVTTLTPDFGPEKKCCLET